MNIDSEELEQYVKQVAESLKSGLDDAEVGEDFEARLDGSIEFEVEVVNEKTKEGGIKLKLAKAGSDKQQQTTNRISFSVSLNKTDVTVAMA